MKPVMLLLMQPGCVTLGNIPSPHPPLFCLVFFAKQEDSSGPTKALENQLQHSPEQSSSHFVDPPSHQTPKPVL